MPIWVGDYPSDSTAAGQIMSPYPIWRLPMPPPRVIGWECPKCGAVYGPQVEACKHCAPKGEANG